MKFFSYKLIHVKVYGFNLLILESKAWMHVKMKRFSCKLMSEWMNVKG